MFYINHDLHIQVQVLYIVHTNKTTNKICTMTMLIFIDDVFNDFHYITLMYLIDWSIMVFSLLNGLDLEVESN